jgi:hypothetical protein
MRRLKSHVSSHGSFGQLNLLTVSLFHDHPESFHNSVVKFHSRFENLHNRRKTFKLFRCDIIFFIPLSFGIFSLSR